MKLQLSAQMSPSPGNFDELRPVRGGEIPVDSTETRHWAAHAGRDPTVAGCARPATIGRHLGALALGSATAFDESDGPEPSGLTQRGHAPAILRDGRLRTAHDVHDITRIPSEIRK
jgi:hypothetical protein